jgi:hypothetical protein
MRSQQWHFEMKRHLQNAVYWNKKGRLERTHRHDLMLPILVGISIADYRLASGRRPLDAARPRVYRLLFTRLLLIYLRKVS